MVDVMEEFSSGGQFSVVVSARARHDARLRPGSTMVGQGDMEHVADVKEQCIQSVWSIVS